MADGNELFSEMKNNNRYEVDMLRIYQLKYVNMKLNTFIDDKYLIYDNLKYQQVIVYVLFAIRSLL